MTDHPIVRVAQSSDETEIMDLCRLLWEENGLFTMSEDRVRSVLRRAWDRQGGIIGVIGEAGKIEAVICLILSTFWYSDQWIIEELFNYVHPEHRKSPNAKHLIEFAKKCSVEIGLPLLIGIISNERTEQKIRLYQRQLEKPRGAFFVFNDNKQPVQKAS